MPKVDVAWINSANYHAELEKLINKHYGLSINLSTTLSWGYSTNSFYLESGTKKFVARVSDASAEKQKSLERDVYVCTSLAQVLPVTNYIKNTAGEYITPLDFVVLGHDNSVVYAQKVLIRLSQHIEGVPPFTMTFAIFDQMLALLKILHAQDPTKFNLPHLTPNASTANTVLLHGDVTPSNVLVSYDKVVAILDFERAVLGLPEWDLASCIVFAWYRMPNTPFKNIFNQALQTYGHKDLSADNLLEFCLTHAKNHFNNIYAHREHYEKKADWFVEYAFAKQKLAELQTVLKG